MRLIFFLIFLLMLSACSARVQQVPESEAGKIQQAEQLIRFSLSDRLLENVGEQTREQVQALLAAKGMEPDEAERILNQELDIVLATEEQRLLDALVPVYRRYYTADEISQLLSFYKTDVARKSQRVSGQIAAELRQYVQRWNEHFQQQLLERVNEALAEQGIRLGE